MNRDIKGRFLPGNRTSIKGGKARMDALSPAERKSLSKKGYQAFVDKYFNGDREAAGKWIAAKGLAAQDSQYKSYGFNYFKDPGPLVIKEDSDV